MFGKIMLTCIIFAVFSLQATESKRNLLPNPSFESSIVKKSVTRKWFFFNSGGSTGTGIADSTLFHSGRCSLKIESTNRKGYSRGTISRIRVKPYTTYEFSGWYKTAGGHDNSIAVVLFRNKKFATVSHTSLRLNGSSEWKFFSREIATDKDSVYVGIQLRVQGGKGITWYDDLSLKELGAAKKYFTNQEKVSKVPPQEAKVLKNKAVVVQNAEKCFTGSGVKLINDNSADGGYCVKIDNNVAPSGFNLQWRWDKESNIAPILYVLYATVKVNKKNNSGQAFRCGSYDLQTKRYVMKDKRLLAKEAANMKWEVYRLGTVLVEPGQSCYIGAPNNAQSVSEIFVDDFFLLPVSKNGIKYSQDMNNYRDKAVKFYLTTDTAAFSSLKLKNLKKLKIGFLVSDDKREKTETFVGLIIDFHTSKGYKRTLISLGLCGNKIMPGREINIDRVGKRVISNIIKLYSTKTLGQYHRTDIKLAEYAPSDWDGEVWLSFAVIESRATFSGIVITPLRKEMKILKYEVSKGKGNNFIGFDNQSIKHFKNNIKSDTFKSRMKKLRQQGR